MTQGKDEIPTEGTPHILIQNVTKTYASASGDVRALTDVSLSIKNGEFISLLGPSGCGKSTLLKLVAGLDTATTGTLSLANKAIAGPPAGLGMVFQKDVLLDWRTVQSNITRYGNSSSSSRAEASAVSRSSASAERSGAVSQTSSTFSN